MFTLRADTLLAVTGGDYNRARTLILESYGPSLAEAAAAAASSGGGIVHNVSTSGGGYAGTIDAAMSDGSDYWNEGMNSFGHLQFTDKSLSSAVWVENAGVMQQVRSNLATFDRQAGIGVLIGPAVGSMFATGGLYGLAGTGAFGVKAVIGGGVAFAYTEASTRAITGKAPTWGNLIGSTTFGAVFAPGVAGFTSLGGPIRNGLANGALAAASSNSAAQAIDYISHDGTDISYVEFLLATGAGAFTGGVGGSVGPLYARTPSIGNSKSILAGAAYGLKVQINSAPSTVATTVAQGYVDPFVYVVTPSEANPGPQRH